MATFSKDRREKLLKIIEDRLYGTAWGKHCARPSQVRAAAKKALDRARADVKKIKKQKAAERGDCRGAL
jgi:hypothetical protein